ncbi:MAG: 16S rRNA (adenine(1518)-N(6)/adenine(1519)-N(6))-dimethyltransferase RsmA [Firmicutes bacterium]|nr:16S rRNA (adenine(1518)-N(6)/adenine(1519)-N(6))-dimethyltransferase RsmA [Bacillota bacterium]
MISAKKSLGQNFIFDTGLLDSIVAKIGILKTDTVIEVGTGPGALTTCIAKHAGRVVTYEVDTRLESVLEKKFAPFGNIEVVFQDILKVTELPDDFIVVANIPYYITTPIIMRFLSDARCRRVCVLVQKEVAIRLAATPGGKDYGALSVAVSSRGSAKIIKHVPRGVFRPVPNVDSAFVVIEKTGSEPPKGFDAFLKSVFTKRRKKISNIVPMVAIEKSGIDPNLRPENLTANDFVKIYQNMTKAPTS